MALYQSNMWDYAYPAIEEAFDFEVMKQIAALTHEVHMLKRAKEHRQLVVAAATCAICGEYGHYAFICQSIEVVAKRQQRAEAADRLDAQIAQLAEDVREIVQWKEEKELIEPRIEDATDFFLASHDQLQTPAPMHEHCSYIEMIDLLDENEIVQEFLTNLGEEPIELLEEHVMATTNILNDAKVDNISTPPALTVEHCYYIVASDAFFTKVLLQGDNFDEREVISIPTAKLSVEGNSTLENWMSSIPSTPGSTSVEDEDELIKVMEWLKLEFEFG